MEEAKRAAGWLGNGKFRFCGGEPPLNTVIRGSIEHLLEDATTPDVVIMPNGLEVFDGMEIRDHPDPNRRTGVLKGISTHFGPGFGEITTYDCLDSSLRSARGNLVLTVETWCAALLLETLCRTTEDMGLAERARALADRTAAALDDAKGLFPANSLETFDTAVIAAIEPLGVPLKLGLRESLKRHGSLLKRLRRHAESCLIEGVCINAVSGGLRLSLDSENTWGLKVALCLYVAEEMWGIDIARESSTFDRELVRWAQVSSAEKTVADQISCPDRRAVNGFHCPRLVSSFCRFPNESQGLI